MGTSFTKLEETEIVVKFIYDKNNIGYLNVDNIFEISYVTTDGIYSFKKLYMKCDGQWRDSINIINESIKKDMPIKVVFNPKDRIIYMIQDPVKKYWKKLYEISHFKEGVFYSRQDRTPYIGVDNTY